MRRLVFHSRSSILDSSYITRTSRLVDRAYSRTLEAIFIGYLDNSGTRQSIQICLTHHRGRFKSDLGLIASPFDRCTCCCYFNKSVQKLFPHFQSVICCALVRFYFVEIFRYFFFFKLISRRFFLNFQIYSNLYGYFNTVRLEFYYIIHIWKNFNRG